MTRLAFDGVRVRAQATLGKQQLQPITSTRQDVDERHITHHVEEGEREKEN